MLKVDNLRSKDVHSIESQERKMVWNNSEIDFEFLSSTLILFEIIMYMHMSIHEYTNEEEKEK